MVIRSSMKKMLINWDNIFCEVKCKELKAPRVRERETKEQKSKRSDRNSFSFNKCIKIFNFVEETILISLNLHK